MGSIIGDNDQVEGDSDDKEESVANTTTEEEVEGLYDQFEIEEDQNYVFDRIVDHHFDQGVLHLKVNM